MKIKPSKKYPLLVLSGLLLIAIVFSAVQLIKASPAVTNPGHPASSIGGTDIADRTFQNAVYSFPGNVGIGTTGPVAKLDVYGSIFVNGGSGDVDLSGAVTAADALILAQYAAGTATLTREQLANADLDGNGVVTWEDRSILAAMLVAYSRETAERATHSIAYEDGAGSISDNKWSSRAFIVDGNVGIGTTIPGAKLEVAGQVKITGGSPGAGKVLTSDATGLASWQTAGGVTRGIAIYNCPTVFTACVSNCPYGPNLSPGPSYALDTRSTCDYYRSVTYLCDTLTTRTCDLLGYLMPI